MKGDKKVLKTSFEIQRDIMLSKLFKKIKLSNPAKLVLWSLAAHYNNDTGKIYPSQSTIADTTGLDRFMVNKAIKELTKIGFLISAGEIGKSKTYFFTSKFFESIEIISKASSEKYVCQIDTPHVSNRHTPLCQIDTQTNNINKDLKKSDFFKKNNIKESRWGEYFDVFEKMSKKALEDWKALQGYDKEKDLIRIRKETKKNEINSQAAEERKAIKPTSPLDFDFDQATDYLNNLPPMLYNSYFATELRKKYNLEAPKYANSGTF